MAAFPRPAGGVARAPREKRGDRRIASAAPAGPGRAGRRRQLAHADQAGAALNARRALPVALWIAVLALCAVQVARTRFVADLSSFLPEAPTAEQRLLVDQLREGPLARAILVAIEGSDAAARARLSKATAAALRSDPRFAAVANGAAAGLEREKDFVFAHRYALSPEVSPARFTVEGLRAAISQTLSLLASPAGALVKPLVQRDPTGETL